MPRINPLDKLVNKARRLRDHHQERHRPSGFGFSLADRVDYVDPVRWDALTAQSSMFLSRRYLRVRLGARPDPMRIWIRHRIPMLNVFVRGLLHTISHHDEPPERNPFK